MKLEEFIKTLLKPEQDEIEKNVCLWLAENLYQLEKITGKNLYIASENNRKRRPFLTVYCKGETFAVIFLTSSSRGYQKKVDLRLCKKHGCPNFYFYDEEIFRGKTV